VFGSSALQSFSSSALLTEALEASISFPVIFKPKKMKAGSKVLALADGGIRENCPISVAARVPGVKRIIACDLGYCGQLKGDFNKKGMIDVFMQCLELTTSFSQINRYINDDLFTDNKISVRIINPGIFDVGPFAFGKVPDVLKRASRTAGRVFGAFKKPEQFFKPWSTDPIKRRGIKIERIGERGTNAVQIVDFS
jgi:predicted acylesterase/phospholipase RssA